MMKDESYFEPSASLTFATVLSDGARLQALLSDTSTNSICIDLSKVQECDSAGLALLIEAKRLSKRYEKKLNIKSMPKVISSLATFCGVETMLE